MPLHIREDLMGLGKLVYKCGLRCALETLNFRHKAGLLEIVTLKVQKVLEGITFLLFGL